MTAQPFSAGGNRADALAWQMQAAGMPEPVAELRFHKSRRWRFDLALVAHKIGIEVDGGTWTGGRHVTGSGFAADLEKLNEAQLDGWLVIRVTPSMVDSGEALRLVERAIALQEG